MTEVLRRSAYQVLPPRIVANQILFLRSQIELQTTPLEIIKLVYICHGWMLGLYGKKLISEPVEAWRYGPVVPSIYRTFKSFRGEPIDPAFENFSGELDVGQNALIKEVVKQYKDYSGLALSHITHRKGTPWYRVYRKGKGLGSIIPDHIIRTYYARLAR